MRHYWFKTMISLDRQVTGLTCTTPFCYTPYDIPYLCVQYYGVCPLGVSSAQILPNIALVCFCVHGPALISMMTVCSGYPMLFKLQPLSVAFSYANDIAICVWPVWTNACLHKLNRDSSKIHVPPIYLVIGLIFVQVPIYLANRSIVLSLGHIFHPDCPYRRQFGQATVVKFIQKRPIYWYIQILYCQILYNFSIQLDRHL